MNIYLEITEVVQLLTILQTEYQMYMKRVKARENNLNQMKDMCREINNLKAELFEIKDILKTLCDKGNK